MITPILPMIPKIIVALGESADVVRTGSGIGVELRSIGSALRDKSLLLIESSVLYVGARKAKRDWQAKKVIERDVESHKWIEINRRKYQSRV
jgi:hypothetical protein